MKRTLSLLLAVLTLLTLYVPALAEEAPEVIPEVTEAPEVTEEPAITPEPEVPAEPETVAALPTAKLTGIASIQDGMQITWDPVPGAVQYRLYYAYPTNFTWRLITMTEDTTYVWPIAPSGEDVCIRIQSVAADGTYGTSGSYSTVRYVATPRPTAEAWLSGVYLKWDRVAGAKKYRVFYKTGDSDWIALTDTTDTSWIWSEAKFGAFTFAVRCYDSTGQNPLSDYGVTKPLSYIPTGRMTSAENTMEGIRLTWPSFDAPLYRVLCRTDGEWTALAEVADTGYTWTGGVTGTRYTFMVQCLDGAGNHGAIGLASQSVDYVAATRLTSAAWGSDGVQLHWNEAPGVAQYRLYYRVGGGEWTALADVTGTEYTWTGADPSAIYAFTVQCMDAAGHTGAYDGTGLTVNAKAAPTVKAANGYGGVKITWSEIKGAERYRVFGMTASGKKWVRLADVTGTSYLWTSAKNGGTYAFAVRGLTGDGKAYTSPYRSSSSLKYMAAPVMKTAAWSGKNVKLSWGAVTGAAQYRVFYKTGGGKWTKLADTKATSYTWTKAKANTVYFFTVRCLSANGKSFTSDYNAAGKLLAATAAPKLTGAACELDGVKITWQKLSGAENYRLYYKTGKGGWTKLADTASTSYTWTGAASGTKYAFTVRGLTADGKSFTSAYDKTGKSVTYIAAPKPSVSSASDGVKISWEAVPGAAQYRVFYKNDAGKWTKLADTAATDHTWTGASNGTTYTFTVRCLSANGKSFTSAFDTNGKTITYDDGTSHSGGSSGSSGGSSGGSSIPDMGHERTCSICGGTGRRTCLSCSGLGHVLGDFTRRCSSCGGLGWRPCSTCGGDGKIFSWT